MRNRTTIVLLGIAIGLTLYYVAFERGRTGPETRLGLLFRYRTVDQVARLSIARGGERIVLERHGDAWRMLEPVAYPAETPRVEDLILRIFEFELKGEFRGSVEDAFPEKGPEAVLTVAFRDGESKEIEVGNPHPSIDVRDRFYRVDGRLVIADPRLADALRVSVGALRERIVSPVTRDRATWISVEAADGRVLRFIRTAPGHWSAEAPFRGRADANAVGELVEAVNRLSVMDFVDEGREKLAAYGLDRPRVRIAVREGGVDAETRILLGDPLAAGPDALAGGSLMYLTWEERGPVCAVRDVVTDLIRKPDEAYRDHRLLDIGADPPARILVAWGGESFELRRDGEAWTLRDGRGEVMPTTRDLVEAFIAELQGIEILSFVPPPGEPGLASPALRIEIDFAEPRRRIAASLGRPDPPESRVFFSARVEGEEGIVSVRTDLPNAIAEWGRYYVRDRVVARIPFDKIEKLRIQTPENRWVLVRLPNRWVIEGRDEEEGLLDVERAMDAAGVFVETRAAFLADPPPSPAAAGLESPAVRIRVDCIEVDGFEPPYRELAIGRRPDAEGGFAWAKFDRIDLIFRLSTAEIDALIAHLREIGQ